MHKSQILNISSLILIGGLFFSLPVSTAATNIFFMILCIVGAYQIFNHWLNKNNNLSEIFSKSQFLSFPVFFFLILALSLFASKNFGVILSGMGKYFEMVMVPIFALFIARSNIDRYKVVTAFSAAMIVTLVLSYTIFFDVFPFKSISLQDSFLRRGLSENPTVFKLHITQNFFMALAVLVWGRISFQEWSTNRWSSLIYLVICLLGCFNIFFMVQGRTGYLVIPVALVYLLLNRYKYKGLIYASVLLSVMLAVLIYMPSSFQSRVVQGVHEILSWTSTQSSSSSMGMRMEFVYNSFGVAANHLFLGTGIGSFSEVYKDFVAGTGMIETVNPHNQYIHFLVEVGLIGLVAFLVLNYICWQSSAKLSYFWKHATRIVLLSYGVANLFNSFLFDFSESLFFSAFMALAFSELFKNSKNSVDG